MAEQSDQPRSLQQIQVCIDCNRLQQAERLLKQQLGKAPRSPELWQVYALIKSRQGARKAARKARRKAAALLAHAQSSHRLYPEESDFDYIVQEAQQYQAADVYEYGEEEPEYHHKRPTKKRPILSLKQMPPETRWPSMDSDDKTPSSDSSTSPTEQKRVITTPAITTSVAESRQDFEVRTKRKTLSLNRVKKTKVDENRESPKHIQKITALSPSASLQVPADEHNSEILASEAQAISYQPKWLDKGFVKASSQTITTSSPALINELLQTPTGKQSSQDTDYIQQNESTPKTSADALDDERAFTPQANVGSEPLELNSYQYPDDELLLPESDELDQDWDESLELWEFNDAQSEALPEIEFIDIDNYDSVQDMWLEPEPIEPREPDTSILTSSLLLSDKARLRAIQFIYENDWPISHIDFLTVLLSSRGYGAIIKTLERHISEGMTPDEFIIASKIQSYWKQSPHLWIRISKNGHSDDAYRNISWSDCLRVIKTLEGPYDSLPDMVEIQESIEILYEEWISSPVLIRYYRAFNRYFSMWLYHSLKFGHQRVAPNRFGGFNDEEVEAFCDCGLYDIAQNTLYNNLSELGFTHGPQGLYRSTFRPEHIMEGTCIDEQVFKNQLF
ncbi:hypothetical protein [uncultured Photobacterium sp.]|uniref:hypothetical protein n=1 Tax=uncultured Photobacterium sp. TaxID=173973 RepID=UPI00260216E5|nr:hypothetical protein [uncultured Photobacterium sp.]